MKCFIRFSLSSGRKMKMVTDGNASKDQRNTYDRSDDCCCQEEANKDEKKTKQRTERMQQNKKQVIRDFNNRYKRPNIPGKAGIHFNLKVMPSYFIYASKFLRVAAPSKK